MCPSSFHSYLIQMYQRDLWVNMKVHSMSFPLLSNCVPITILLAPIFKVVGSYVIIVKNYAKGVLVSQNLSQIELVGLICGLWSYFMGLYNLKYKSHWLQNKHT